MGLQGVFLNFTGQPPDCHSLLAIAQQLAGKPIALLANAKDHYVVAFQDAPGAQVTISLPNANRLFLVDFSLIAPSLLALLVHSGIQLGGQLDSGVSPPPLSVPPATKPVRSHQTSTHASAVPILALVIALLVLAAVWWVATGAP